MHIVFFLFAFGRNIRQIISPAADRRIGRAAARYGGRIAAIYASRRQSFPMHRFEVWDITKPGPSLGKFDVALPTGSYKIAIRHPKLGKVEEEVLINALESSKVSKVMQFKL